MLENSKIYDDGAVAVSESLKVNKSLEDLNLSNCGIRARGGKAIGEALQLGISALSKLDLRNNTGLGNAAKQSLRDAVAGRDGFELVL